jgi:hypothetical protein
LHMSRGSAHIPGRAPDRPAHRILSWREITTGSRGGQDVSRFRRESPDRKKMPATEAAGIYPDYRRVAINITPGGLRW